MESLTTRCAWAIKTIQADSDLDRGITDVDLAKILDTDKNTVSRYRREKGSLMGKVIDNLVKRYDFNPMWLFKGEGEPFPGARAKYEDVCGPERPTFTDEFALVPQVAGSISAGGGLIPDEGVDLRVAFRRDWIARKGRSQNMSLIKVRGDSMEPTLLDGDLVMVDHGRNSIASQGGIYAISINDEIMIKRVMPVYPDKLLVISDNKQYPPQEWAAENVRVNGKVIWYARDLER
jgi:phage repressor protein C with HTH and peptisase S24 domain